MSSMSESMAEKRPQNENNSDLEGNKVQIECNCEDESTGVKGEHHIGSDVPNRPDAGLTNESESKTIDCDHNSESESEVAISGTNGTTGSTGVAQLNGMRTTGANSTHSQTPDVCSGSQHTATDDGVNGIRGEPSQDSHTSNGSNGDVSESGNEVIIIETVVKSDSNEVTLITDTTLKTTIRSFNQSFSDCSSESSHESNTDNYPKNSNKSNEMTTTTTSRPKQLKSLLKRGIKEKSMKANGNNGRRRVTFSETMQVFCDDWPQNLMPQIIALKSPTDFNLVEVQGYMFEPPVEYQDFLPFEPPPDYRDLIANSLCALENDLNIHYIDDEDDSAFMNAHKSVDHKLLSEFSSKWESLILNNNESLEEEQIIGVLKEDAILQAIGSHISLPDEQLCPEDFPIHFHTKANESSVKLAESELSDITSDDGNDSTGSLQDIQSDSSITSQDTIILINHEFNDESNDNFEILSHKNCFNDMQTSNEDMSCATDSESVVKYQTPSDDKSTKSDAMGNELNCETNNSLISRDPNETNSAVKGVEVEVDSTTDVTQEVRGSESEESDDTSALDCELNGDKKEFKLFTDESNDIRNNHSQAFRRNLMFFQNNMFSDNNKTENNENNSRQTDRQTDRPTKQTVSHFVIDNTPKYPIITQTVSNTNSDKSVVQTSDISVENKQTSNEVNSKPMNTLNDTQSMHMRAPTLQTTPQPTEPNSNNWSTDEFIIEYTSEPKALVPSKRTASLSNFMTATNTTNPQMIRNSPNYNNIQYLSLNRNGEIPKQWNTYTIDLHNNSQQIRYQLPPNQRSLSPNPSMMSANTRPVSPQQVYYQPRPHYTGNVRYPTGQPMPVQVMYNRMPGPHVRPNLQLPVMSQTMGPPHKQPPPYHYHIQQHNNEFPNPSEIRRRDGLNAYPHVLNQTPQAGALPVPPIHHNNPNTSPQTMSKDELEQFVQQDIQRTERIKKRYSMTEEDDPSFGFARRPSVRGIRPKFGTTNDILNQIQTQSSNGAIGAQMAGSHVSWPQINNHITNSTNSLNSNPMVCQQNQSFQKKPQIVHIRLQSQNPMPVKYANEAPEGSQFGYQSHGPPGAPQMSRTLPRPSSLISQSHMNAIRTEEGLVIRLPANTSRDQLKQQIQRQLEQQLQTKMKQKMNSMPMSSTAIKPVMSSNDERGAPEGASSSPKHSSDVLFAKNLSTNCGSSVKSGETNRQQTNDTKKLVIHEENNTNSNEPKDKEGVIYYSMNV